RRAVLMTLSPSGSGKAANNVGHRRERRGRLFRSGPSGRDAATAPSVRAGRRPLIHSNSKHRLARRAWLALYVFVAIQMSWILRPFIGDPTLSTRFFRAQAWGNAYVELANVIWRAVSD
ncbi:MAG: hypothetical protein JXO72_05360, partial [Vicinamibacteria bacterium]|nr:hypothetical protein [Vicinamibacteria bacterium]